MVDPPHQRMLCDSMLGSLARWLRLAGHDTLYVDELVGGTCPDEQVIALAREHDALLLTRDKQLAGRVGDGALLITTKETDEQLRFVVQTLALPPGQGLSRCSRCNGVLEQTAPPDAAAAETAGIPPAVANGQQDLWQCSACAQYYWVGSHSDRIKAALHGL